MINEIWTLEAQARALQCEDLLISVQAERDRLAAEKRELERIISAHQAGYSELHAENAELRASNKALAEALELLRALLLYSRRPKPRQFNLSLTYDKARVF
ncbi:MAG: hypothetical protein Q7N50_13390, partial [Armatimonadota bacterium]|nr:hypothetical protein [Armatimonadota bacterium]